jgi:uncharacterized protein (TIGR00369 family)
MTEFTPKDPDFAAKVRDSFARQPFMRTIGAELVRVAPGFCEITLPFRPELCQQHGYLHAGVTTTLADNAAGYAAFSLMPADSSVLSVEFKINLIAPAQGEHFLARATVEKPGRTLTVVRADVFDVQDGQERCVATMLATLMCLEGKPDRAG